MRHTRFSLASLENSSLTTADSIAVSGLSAQLLSSPTLEKDTPGSGTSVLSRRDAEGTSCDGFGGGLIAEESVGGETEGAKTGLEEA
jgi:hypothetical protein